jgi:hypothetical protein
VVRAVPGTDGAARIVERAEPGRRHARRPHRDAPRVVFNPAAGDLATGFGICESCSRVSG